MKAYRLTSDMEDGYEKMIARKGSILILSEDEAADNYDDGHIEEVPDGTPISIPASRIEPVDPGIDG